MPSPRRLRLLVLATLVVVVLMLVYTSRLDDGKKDTRTLHDFYHKTMDGISSRAGRGQAVIDSKTGNRAGRIPADTDGDGDVDDDDRRAAAQTKERLREAEMRAKDLANDKALKPESPREVVGKGNSAEGQVRRPAVAADGVAMPVAADKTAKQQSQEELDADAELEDMIKAVPVIIFSKTFCSYSKRAKGVLLEKYDIVPLPRVVELDLEKDGSLLQARLAARTGRSTVPNILVRGKSIGGSDEIVELDYSGGLVARIQSLGGGGVDVAERFSTQGRSLRQQRA